MILGIYDFESLSSNQIVITINNGHNFTTITKSSCGIVNVWKGLFIDFVLNKQKSRFLDLIFLDVTVYFLCCSILRGIVNVNNVIILIILLKDWVQVSEIFVLIFITWNNDTKRYFAILTYLILLFVFKFLLKFQSLHFFKNSLSWLWSWNIMALITDILII